MATPASTRFLGTVADLGIDVHVQRFPEGTRTAADAAAAVGCHVAQIVKSMVFVARHGAVLALTAGSNRVDPAGLAAHLGVDEVRRATPEEVRDATGFAIGGTPPFGHPRPLPTVIDPDLLAHETVWAAGGTPDTCFAVSPHTLVEITGAAVAADAFTS